MADHTSEVSDLLALQQAAKGLMHSPGWETFRDHLHRQARSLYLAAVAGGNTAQRLRALDQASVLHEVLEGFGLQAQQWDQILHQERMIDDQQYRIRARSATGGRPRPYDPDLEALRLKYEGELNCPES